MQQLAFVEQMKHAEMMEFKTRKAPNARNPLLAEETSRSQKRGVMIREPPEKRTLLGGHFVRTEDMCTARKTDLMRITKMREERDRRAEAGIRDDDENDLDKERVSTARSRLAAAQSYAGGGGVANEHSARSARSYGRTPRPRTAGSCRSSSRSIRPEWDDEEEVRDRGGSERTDGAKPMAWALPTSYLTNNLPLVASLIAGGG